MPSAARAAAVALALAGSVAAQAERPPAGQPVDVTRTIPLLPRVAPPCVAVRADGASILLARTPLEAAARSTPRAWTTEREREALIRGNRAKALLALATGPSDATGCVPVDRARLGDAAHLVVDRLEAGEASVVGADPAAPDRTIAVHYLGVRAGPSSGRGEIRFLRGEPRRAFLVVEWWAS